MYDEPPSTNRSSVPADIASLFPGARGCTYLSTCTRGLLPTTSRAALDAHLSDLEAGQADKTALFESVERARAGFAGLVRCAAQEVAITKNVSEGLNIVAAGIDWRAGDNVVVCLSVEHPNNVYPWLNLRERHGVEVRTFADREGHVDTDRLLATVDTRTRLVTMPTVSFSPGFRADVATVGRACRERGIFLLADGVQSVGVLDTNVDAMGVDGLAVSTQKALCGLYGMGFLYVRAHWAERMRPAYLARFGVDLGPAHEAAQGSARYRLAPAARRFDLGNYNYPAALAVEQSLQILNAVGTAAIEVHVAALVHRAVGGLLDLGLPVAGGAAGPHTASIISIGRLGADGHDGTDDADIARLSARMEAGGIVHTIRRGMIRLAFHLYNTQADVDRVLELCRAHCSAG